MYAGGALLPNPLSTLFLFCVARKEKLEYFFFFWSPSLPAIWQLHHSVITAPTEQSPFRFPSSALTKLNLHYLPFFKNGEAYGCSIGSWTSSIDSPKPYHTSENRSFITFSWKIPADHAIFVQLELFD